MNETQSALLVNPFRILGATPRDDRRRIVELASEKVLELDERICQKARSDLTNPRSRLSVEAAWLPGISPSKAFKLAERVQPNPPSAWGVKGLPPLAHANLLSASCEVLQPSGLDQLPDHILKFAVIVDEISPEAVLRNINEDRAVAGFPAVGDLQLIEEQLQQRRQHFRSAIKSVLNRLPPRELVETVTNVVGYATKGGEYHAPALIDDLVDMYRVETQEFLQKECANINALIDAARREAASGEAAVEPIVDKVAAVTRNWDRVAQPIQLSFMARGQHHPASNEVAYSIRGLAVDLFNNYDMLNQAQRLADLLKNVFAEVPEVTEKVAEDVEVLDSIFANREQAESRREEWAKAVTYRAEIGTAFKKVLSISSSGLTWGNRHFPLESITRVRWGGVRHSVNGIPTGTTYTIAFGDLRSEAVVETRRKAVYSAFIERLFRAVGVRLLTELLETVRQDQAIFGEAVVRDTAVLLPRQKFLRANELVECPWRNVTIWSEAGMFCMAAKTDKKVRTALSYIDTPNTHILEQAIRTALRRGAARLSDVLAGERF